VALDVLIGGVSIFTTAPKIDNDGTDPCHTLVSSDTAVATYLGTTGSFGLINKAAAYFAKGSIITFANTKASTPDGTGYHMQVDALLFGG
jgi:hypothetical protein